MLISKNLNNTFAPTVTSACQQRTHSLPVGVTFDFSLLDFKKHIYTIFAIIRLVCYTCKHTNYKQQYFYANLLLIKILTRKIYLIIAKLKINASGRILLLKKLNHPIPKGLKSHSGLCFLESHLS